MRDHAAPRLANPTSTAVQASSAVVQRNGGGEAANRLSDAVLHHLLNGGSPEASLRAMASGIGISHSLLLYHFGSTAGLLGAVYHRCESRERDHLTDLTFTDTDPIRVMRHMWQHLADPAMWPTYRLSYALRLRADVPTGNPNDERHAWTTTLKPLLSRVGYTGAAARHESLLWVATCRGLLWELIAGADPHQVHRAADRFFCHYQNQFRPKTPQERPANALLSARPGRTDRPDSNSSSAH